jgi:hypothetical protein
VELAAHVHRAGDLEERGLASAVVVDLGVGVIVADDQVMASGEGHHLAEELERGGRRRRVVRIIQVHHAHAGAALHDGLELFEVGEKTVLLAQREWERQAAHQMHGRGVDGVARIGHEHPLAGIHEGEREVGDALLGADQREDFALGLYAHAEASLEEPRGRAAELDHAPVRRILVVGRIARSALDGLQDERGRREVRIADAERDQLAALGELGPLDLVDPGEDVGREFPDVLRDREPAGGVKGGTHAYFS